MVCLSCRPSCGPSSLNIPVSSDDHGQQQGSGGGEPGKAYLAYHRALSGKDKQAIKTLLSEERRATWAASGKKGNDSAFLAFLPEDHPTEVRVTEAFIKGDRALVLLERKAAEGRILGEVLLSRRQEAWRFEEETLQNVVK